jgi:hypothetical protein
MNEDGIIVMAVAPVLAHWAVQHGWQVLEAPPDADGTVYPYFANTSLGITQWDHPCPSLLITDLKNVIVDREREIANLKMELAESEAERNSLSIKSGEFLADSDFAVEVKRINSLTSNDWRGILGLSSLDDDEPASKKYRRLMLALHSDKRKARAVSMAGGADAVDSAFHSVQAAYKESQRKCATVRHGQSNVSAQSGCVGGSRRRPLPPSPPPMTEEYYYYSDSCCPMPPPHKVTGKMHLL